MTGKPQTRHDWSGLHVLADDDPRWASDPVAQARAACAGGCRVVQLRAKHAIDRQTLLWAREIRALTRACGARFVVNDRFDLALAAEADGVHLGQTDLAPADIPKAARARLGVGRSTHTLLQAKRASAEPVDYIALGPVFGTASKASDYGPRGLALVSEAARIVAPRPLVAIGGIEPANLASVITAGAGGAAVISAVAGAPDPEAASRELCEIFAGTAAGRAR